MMSIGCVTVSQSNPDLVWVGTGEVNNRQTTSFGDGVYKSTDGGKTFQKMGLARSQHVARIVIDPTNDNVVLVASNGSLFGAGGDRGIFKTTDGGHTWKNVLATDSLTGATELVMAPSATEDSLCSDVSAATLRARDDEHGTRQRDVEIHRRRRHVDEALGRFADRFARSHRPRDFPAELQRRLRGGRSWWWPRCRTRQRRRAR